VKILSNGDVSEIDVAEVISVMADAIRQSALGGLDSPPRAHAPVRSTRSELVFTVGATSTAVGFRVYGRAPGLAIEQATLVYDRATGKLLGVVVGNELGTRRTAGIGAVAADALARPDASRVGVVGSGRHAFAQLWGLLAVRRAAEVLVFSPTRDRRESFAKRALDELQVDCRAVSDARSAVEGSEILIFATRSTRPCVDATWFEPGSHVTTLGSATISSHELPRELLLRAESIVTDSPAELAALSHESWIGALPGQLERTRSLGDVLTGQAAGRLTPSGITVFCSLGLAGTEVALAERLFRSGH
jgi:ornithine cyclodeaminase